MRIVIDMQGAQTASRFRGIGRYSMAIAQAIVRNRGGHDVVLALNGLFEDSIQPIRDAFEGLLEPEKICIWTAPGPVNASDPANRWREDLAEQLREAFLASLQPDVLYITSLFEGFVDGAVTSVARWDRDALVCVTVYDFIPLLNPRQYLDPNPVYAAYYGNKVEQFKRAGLFLAISQSSRKEAIEHLGLPSDQVVNIAAACDAHFQHRPVDAEVSKPLLAAWGVTRPFILYTGGADERKNLTRLIRAFAALPEQVRSAYQLLFAGKLSEFELAHLRHVAQSCGLSENDLRFTGFVTDEVLVQVYNLCHLFVFPSWHEGFGLPPLEAMSCGAPVICASGSSLPEVVGWDAALFDPLDEASISGKIFQALTDETFRQALVAHGLQQCRKFSWDACAHAALRSFERALAQRSEAVQALRPWSEIRAAHDKRLIHDMARTLHAYGITSHQALSTLAACMAANEAQAQTLARNGLLPSALNWRVEGPFDSSYSLALVNREFARALSDAGHRVALHSTEGPGDFEPDPRFLQAHPDLATLHARVTTMPMARVDITSRFIYPPRVEDMTCHLNALHCYGWEESQFPRPWVDAFNRHLQGMTVMSSHVARLLVDNGVRVPIAVTGIGVDHWDRIEPDSTFRLHARSFRFLHVSSCFPRKGADAMLRAYARAFRAQDDVSLVIKTFANAHNEIHRWLDEVRAGDPNFPDVQIIEGDWTDGQLKALYEQCHVLVAPSRAEGFGLPLAEAMLSGLAVVTTGWSGQLDFCTSETAWLVDYSFARAESHFGLSDSVWAEPDVPHLAQILREVHDAPAALRSQRSAVGRARLRSTFTWSDVARRAARAARQWAVQGAPVPPRVGWISSWNTRCGIAAFSRYLTERVGLNMQVLASHASELTAPDDARVLRCWHQNDEDTLQALSAAVDNAGFDVIVVQFNYGFFDFQSLSEFLDRQTVAGRTVVVELHATTDPSQVLHKRLNDLLPALSRCARVLVHTLADMNRLKRLGLVHNVTLFPLGIPDHSPEVPPPGARDHFTLASYGFFLPHKGLLELIDAVLLLREQGVRVALKMVNAQYPAPESQQVIDQARARIAESGAQDSIELLTDYLEDNESLQQLADADLIVYPYQQTGESASAAVRHGIASGRPVAVTPLAIFDDVRSAVHVLPGTRPEQMAEGIRKLMEAIVRGDPAIETRAQDMLRWRDEHRYGVLGQRMGHMLAGLHGQSRR